MANVFGNPITDATLKEMEEYAHKSTIASSDRARVALNMQTAHMRDTNARTYVEKLKQQSRSGVSTLCLIYNATGNTLTISHFRDWWGHIGQAPYPIRIQNGQWGAFLHVNTSAGATGSCSAVVFRGKDGNGADCDYMMAWNTQWGNFDNSIWVEARSPNHFTNNWPQIFGYLNRPRYNYSDTWQGCLTSIAIGRSDSPVAEAIFTLEDAAK